MNREKYQTSIGLRWLSVAMLMILPWFTGCANGSLPKPPIKVPFEVQKAGSRVETEVRIVEEKEYRFVLMFMFTKGDIEGEKRVKKLAGGGGVDYNGKSTEPGIPMLLRFKIDIIDSAEEKGLLDQEISELRLSEHASDHYSKRIVYLSLKPGHYRLSAESLKDVPELIGTPVFFQVGFNSKL